MRVLYWTQLFWPYIGGVEVLAAKFLPAMQSRGYEFTVVTSHGALDLPDEATYEGIPIHRFPFHTALTGGDVDQVMTAIQGVSKLKRALKPDLVHTNLTDGSSFFNLRTAAAHPSPDLVTLHVALPDRSTAGHADTVLGQTLRTAAWVTAPSEAMLANARRLAPEISCRSSLAYNGLSAPEVAPAELPFRPPVLLSIGRVVDDKGLDVALKALVPLVNRFPGIRLIIAGDGPARPSLQQLAGELGIGNAVEFSGWVVPERVAELINKATIVVVPSRWQEAFGLVALQAAQMERPVVGTRVGGLPEAVVHGETGLIVENEDADGIANAIAHLLTNPETAVKMGRAGRQRAERLFSWERHIDTYDALYKNLVRNNRKSGDALC